MGYVNESYDSLYHQLIWAVNQLSIGYYAYREGRLTEIQFPDGSTLRLAPDLNAGTVALQYYFAQLYNRQEWEAALSEVSGLPGLHESMFGDPWERASAVEPLFPPGVTQPATEPAFRPQLDLELYRRSAWRLGTGWRLCCHRFCARQHRRRLQQFQHLGACLHPRSGGAHRQGSGGGRPGRRRPRTNRLGAGLPARVN